MDRFVIRGGRPLAGTVHVTGSKNASLPIAVAGGILGTSESRIHHVPRLEDVTAVARLLEHLGASVAYGDGTLAVGPGDTMGIEAPYDLVRKMRASIYVLGPLLARFGHARVSFPGGCAIGPRPIDLHLRGMTALGARVRVEHGFIVAEAERLRGADMSLLGPHGSSVGATANVLMAAVLADGTTHIRDAAREPEIIDLAEFLTAMGARIGGAGTSVLTVEGVSSLAGTDYTVIPDRIAAASYLIAGAITGGDVTVRGAERRHMSAVLGKLTEADVWLDWQDSDVRVRVPHGFRAVGLETAPYPGFPTDMQAQFMGLMCLASGESRIEDHVFTERFMHVLELQRMGADIRVEEGSATVNGVPQLTGAPAMASDLRAGMVLVLAGLAARGETVVSRVYHIDRGYEQLEVHLRALGADVERVSE